MSQLPDAPWIQRAERFGYETITPVQCPVCGEDCDTVYINRAGDPVGCEHCCREKDSYDWLQDEIERMSPE